MTVIDATPLSLGIEIVGGVFSKIIPKGSFIPTKKSQVFTTNENNQARVNVAIFEGERPLTKDNHLLGRFDINDIPPMPAGKPEIEVTFELDDNGILTVTAEEKSKGSKAEITISNDQGRLSREEIESIYKMYI
jgi:heat shock protein 5